jgi:hypothetical protein
MKVNHIFIRKGNLRLCVLEARRETEKLHPEGSEEPVTKLYSVDRVTIE